MFFDNTRYCSCACKVFCHFHYKHIPKEIATQIFKEACVVVKDYSFIVTIEQDPVLSVSGDGNFRAVEKEVINEYLKRKLLLRDFDKKTECLNVYDKVVDFMKKCNDPVTVYFLCDLIAGATRVFETWYLKENKELGKYVFDERNITDEIKLNSINIVDVIIDQIELKEKGFIEPIPNKTSPTVELAKYDFRRFGPMWLKFIRKAHWIQLIGPFLAQLSVYRFPYGVLLRGQSSFSGSRIYVRYENELDQLLLSVFTAENEIAHSFLWFFFFFSLFLFSLFFLFLFHRFFFVTFFFFLLFLFPLFFLFHFICYCVISSFIFI